MANILHYVLQNYSEVVETSRDPQVDSWLLMGSPTPLITILGAYLLFVLKLGPTMMEKQAPFQLNKVMIGYNFVQVLFSIWLASKAVTLDVNVFQSSACSSKSERLRDPKQAALSATAWWYFFAKIIELLDTVSKLRAASILSAYTYLLFCAAPVQVFFVLRKKQSQVTFLHVYHHTTVAFFSWCYLKYLPDVQGVFICFLNTSVHVIMYTYYLIAALGPNFKKYLWWKKYMTSIQLVQFVLMFCYLISILMSDCSMPKGLTYFFLTNVVIFLYLFSDFYLKAYKKKVA